MKIILMSHFNMAKGLKSTLEYFNPIAAEQVIAISAYLEDCDPNVELNKVLSQVEEDELVLVFTDILGGSVNQLTIPYLTRPNFYSFAGMNLGMILQATFLTGNESTEEIKSLVDVGKEGVVCMNDFSFEYSNEDDE